MARIISVVLAGCLLGLTSLSHAVDCPDEFNSTPITEDSCTVVGAASSITINFNEGFDSTDSLSAVGGNPGTTLGQQRKRSFIKAASILASFLRYTVPNDTLVVDAKFTALSCNSNSAVLGSAGASDYSYSNSAGANYEAKTFYPVGLWSELRGVNSKRSGSDVTANFNTNIGNSNCLSGGGWYYGFDTPPFGKTGFVTVLLHEMTHGIGFASLVDAQTGEKPYDFNDIFSNFLYSAEHGAWSDITDSQRAASALSDNGLLWSGANVNNQAIGKLTQGFQDNDNNGSFSSGDRIQMFAPTTFKSGSSVSHFDTAVSPNELMEPNYTEGQFDLGLALYLMKDLGWQIRVDNTAPTLNAENQTTNEDVAKVINLSTWGSDADNDTLTYSIESCAQNITCKISGTTLTLTPDKDFFGNGLQITVKVSDGFESATDTFTLTVISQNDAPEWEAISEQQILQGNSITLPLNNYASDVENHSISFTVGSCGEHLTCSISNNQLTIKAANDFLGTEAVIIKAQDSQGAASTIRLDVKVLDNNVAPVISIPDQTTNEDATLIIDLALFSSDQNNDPLTYSVTTCGTGLTCSISGTQLTMQPNKDFNGTTSITIAVNDGKASSSDTFKLTVNAKNDRPVLSPIGDVAIRINTTKVVSLNASDIDSSKITFTANSDPSIALQINGAQVSLTPTVIGSYSVTVFASDGALQDSAVFNVTVYDELTATDANEGGSDRFKNGDRQVIGLNNYPLTIQGGSGEYSYSLRYDNQNADKLLTVANGNIYIAVPTANDFEGTFAGEYELTVTDKAYNESMTATFIRPPQMTVSSNNILDKQTHHYVAIKGIAPNTTFVLSSNNNGVVFSNEQNQSINSISSSSFNEGEYNVARTAIRLNEVTEITETTIEASSIYEDVSTSLNVHPSIVVRIQVLLADTEKPEYANLYLSDESDGQSQIPFFGMTAVWNSDSQGLIQGVLPTNGSQFQGEVAVSGYNAKTIQLNAAQQNYQVTLSKPEIPLTISGSLKVQDLSNNDAREINFNESAPIVQIEQFNGRKSNIEVIVVNSHHATYTYTHDLNLGSLKAIIIQHQDAKSVSVDLSETTSDVVLDDVLLEALPKENESITDNSIQPVTSGNDDTKSGGSINESEVEAPGDALGNGSLHWVGILMLGLLMIRKKHIV